MPISNPQNLFAKSLQEMLNGQGREGAGYSVSSFDVQGQTRYSITRKGSEGSLTRDWFWGSMGPAGQVIHEGRQEPDRQVQTISAYWHALVDPKEMRPGGPDFNPTITVVSPMQRLLAGIDASFDSRLPGETPDKAYTRITSRGASYADLPAQYLTTWRPQGSKVATDMNERIQLIVRSTTGKLGDIPFGSDELLSYIENSLSSGSRSFINPHQPENERQTWAQVEQWGLGRAKSQNPTLKPHRMFPGGVRYDPNTGYPEILVGRGAEGTPKSASVLFGNTIIDAYVQKWDKNNKQNPLQLEKVDYREIDDNASHPFVLSSVLFPGESQPRRGQLHNVLFTPTIYSGGALKFTDKRLESFLGGKEQLTLGFDRRYVTQNIPIKDMNELLLPGGDTRFDFNEGLIGKIIDAGKEFSFGSFLHVKDPSNPGQSTESMQMTGRPTERSDEDSFMGVEGSLNRIRVNSVSLLVPAFWNSATGEARSGTEDDAEPTTDIIAKLNKLYGPKGINVVGSNVRNFSVVGNVTAFDVGGKYRGLGEKQGEIPTGETLSIPQNFNGTRMNVDVTHVHGEIKGPAISKVMGALGGQSFNKLRKIFDEYAGNQGTEIAASVANWVNRNTRNEDGTNRPLDFMALGQHYTDEAKRLNVVDAVGSGIELAAQVIDDVFYNENVKKAMLDTSPENAQKRKEAFALDARHIAENQLGFLIDPAVSYRQTKDVTNFAYAQALDNLRMDPRNRGKSDAELTKLIDTEYFNQRPTDNEDMDIFTQLNKGIRSFGRLFGQLTPEFTGRGTVNSPQLENFRQFPELANAMGLNPNRPADAGPQKEARMRLYSWWAQTADAMDDAGFKSDDAFSVDSKALSKLAGILADKNVPSNELFAAIAELVPNTTDAKGNTVEGVDRDIYFPKTGFSMPSARTGSAVQYTQFGEDIGGFSRQYARTLGGLVQAEQSSAEGDYGMAQSAMEGMWRLVSRDFDEGDAAKQAQNRDVEYGVSVRYMSLAGLKTGESYTPPSVRELILGLNVPEEDMGRSLETWESEAKKRKLNVPVSRIPNITQTYGINPLKDLARSTLVERIGEEAVSRIDMEAQNRNTVYLSLPTSTSATQGDLDKDIALVTYGIDYVPRHAARDSEGNVIKVNGKTVSVPGNIKTIQDRSYNNANTLYTHQFATQREKDRFTDPAMYKASSAMFKTMQNILDRKDPLQSSKDLEWVPYRDFLRNAKAQNIDASTKMGMAYNLRAFLPNAMGDAGYSKKQANAATDALIPLYQIGLDKWNIGPKGSPFVRFMSSSRFLGDRDTNQGSMESSVLGNKQKDVKIAVDPNPNSAASWNNWVMKAADVATQGIEMGGETLYQSSPEMLANLFSKPEDNSELLGRLSKKGLGNASYKNIVQDFIAEKYQDDREALAGLPASRIALGIAAAKDLLKPERKRNMGQFEEQNPEMMADAIALGHFGNLELKKQISGLGLIQNLSRLGKSFQSFYKSMMPYLPWNNQDIINKQPNPAREYDQEFDIGGGLNVAGKPTTRPSSLAVSDESAKLFAMINRIETLDKQDKNEQTRLIGQLGFPENRRGTAFHEEAQRYAEANVENIWGRGARIIKSVDDQGVENAHEYAARYDLDINGVKIKAGHTDVLVQLADGSFVLNELKSGEGHDMGVKKAELQATAGMLQLKKEGINVKEASILFANKSLDVARFWDPVRARMQGKEEEYRRAHPGDADRLTTVTLDEGSEQRVYEGAKRTLLAQAAAIDLIPDMGHEVFSEIRSERTKSGSEMSKGPLSMSTLIDFLKDKYKVFLGLPMDKAVPDEAVAPPSVLPRNTNQATSPAVNMPSPTASIPQLTPEQMADWQAKVEEYKTKMSQYRTGQGGLPSSGGPSIDPSAGLSKPEMPRLPAPFPGFMVNPITLELTPEKSNAFVANVLANIGGGRGEPPNRNTGNVVDPNYGNEPGRPTGNPYTKESRKVYMKEEEYKATVGWLAAESSSILELNEYANRKLSELGFGDEGDLQGLSFEARAALALGDNPEGMKLAFGTKRKDFQQVWTATGKMEKIKKAEDYAKNVLNLSASSSPDMALLQEAASDKSPLNQALKNTGFLGSPQIRGTEGMRKDTPLNQLPISESYIDDVNKLRQGLSDLQVVMEDLTKTTQDTTKTEVELLDARTKLAEKAEQKAMIESGLGLLTAPGYAARRTLEEERDRILTRQGQEGSTLGDDARLAQINRKLIAVSGGTPPPGPMYDEEGNMTGNEMFASWGGAARKVFGGFGLMYMRNIANIATSGLERGFAERATGNMTMAQMRAQRLGILQAPGSQGLVAENMASAFGSQWSPGIALEQLQYEQPGLSDIANTALSGVAAAGATAWLAQSTMGMYVPSFGAKVAAGTARNVMRRGLTGAALKGVAGRGAVSVGSVLSKAIPWVAAAVMAGQTVAGIAGAYEDVDTTSFNIANRKFDPIADLAYGWAGFQSDQGADTTTFSNMQAAIDQNKRIAYQLATPQERERMIFKERTGRQVGSERFTTAIQYDIPAELSQQEQVGYSTGYYQKLAAMETPVPGQFLAQAAGWAVKNQEFLNAYGAAGGSQYDYLEKLATRYMLSPNADQMAIQAVGAAGGNIADLFKKGTGGTGTDLYLNTKDRLAEYIADTYNEDRQAVIGAGFEFMANTPGVRYLKGIGFDSKTGKVDAPKLTEFGEKMGALAGTPQGALWQARMAKYEQDIKNGKAAVAPEDADYVIPGGKRWVADEVTQSTRFMWVGPEARDMGTPAQIEKWTVAELNAWQADASKQETRDKRSVNALMYGNEQMQANMQNWYQGGITRPEEYGFRDFLMSRSPEAVATAISMGSPSRTMTTNWGQPFSSNLLAGDISATTGMPTGLSKYASSWINGDMGKLSGMSYSDPRNLAAMNKAGLQNLLPGASTGATSWRYKDAQDLSGNMLSGFQAVAWNDEMSQHASTMASFGVQAQSQKAGMAFQTGVGLGAYAGTINPVTGQPFNANFGGGGFWGIQDRQIAMQNTQQQWQFGMQQRQINLGASQFAENMGTQQKQMQMQRGWAREDWATTAMTRDLQWGWKQEDFQEQNRFLTGRERKLSERQMGRDTIMHDIEGEQFEKQKSRAKQTWKLEDERFAIQLKQYNENKKLQQEQLNKSIEFYEENKKLQAEQLELSRAFYIVQQDLQKKSNAIAIANEMKRHAVALDNMTIENKILKDQALALNSSEESWAILEDSFTALNDLIPTFNKHLAETIELMGGTAPTGGGGGGGGGTTDWGDEGIPTVPKPPNKPGGTWKWMGEKWIWVKDGANIPMAAGGYKEFETYGGVEFVMNQMATSAAEQAIGGPLTQRNVMGAIERSRYIESRNSCSESGSSGPTIVNIYLGNEKFTSFILDTVTRELRD